MSPLWFLVIELLGMFPWGMIFVAIIVLYGQPRGWPNWVQHVILDACLVPYELIAGVAGLIIVRPLEVGKLFFYTDLAVAGYFAWCAWTRYDKNRRGRRAPGLLGKIVVDLGGRLGIADA